MDWMALQYRAERETPGKLREFFHCAFSYSSGHVVTLQDRLSWSSLTFSEHDHTVLPGRQSSTRLWFGPDPDLLKLSGRLYTLWPPSAWLIERLGSILFFILRLGDTESIGCLLPCSSREGLWVLFSCKSCRLISSLFHLLFDFFSCIMC